MFVAIGVRSGGQAGYRVFHLRPWDDGSGNHQVTPLGFMASRDGEGWRELRKHLPGVTIVTDSEVSREDYRHYTGQAETAVHMRRVADAAEGN